MKTSSHAKVGLIIAAHAPLAGAMVETARRILADEDDLAVEQVEIHPQDAPAESLAAVEDAVSRAERGAGVLVLADLFGGSAANVSLAQLGAGGVEVVTGANLAMVLEAVTGARRGKSLVELAERVAEVARSSVVVAGALLAPTGSREQAAA